MKKTSGSFESKIRQPSAVIKEYVEYIKFQQTLIGSIKQRTKDKKSAAAPTILSLIADRIKVIYSQALLKFPTNLRFWDEYIKFLQALKLKEDISSAFGQMLQVELYIQSYFIWLYPTRHQISGIFFSFLL